MIKYHFDQSAGNSHGVMTFFHSCTQSAHILTHKCCGWVIVMELIKKETGMNFWSSSKKDAVCKNAQLLPFVIFFASLLIQNRWQKGNGMYENYNTLCSVSFSDCFILSVISYLLNNRERYLQLVRPHVIHHSTLDEDIFCVM